MPFSSENRFVTFIGLAVSILLGLVLVQAQKADQKADEVKTTQAELRVLVERSAGELRRHDSEISALRAELAATRDAANSRANETNAAIGAFNERLYRVLEGLRK